MHLAMKLHSWSFILALACCTLAGCRADHRPVTREELAGSYTYVSKDPDDVPADHNLSRLVLKANGGYDLVEGGTAKAVSERRGVWILFPRDTIHGQPPNVQLDNAGYPVEIKGNEVRLMVDYDVGIWWVKVK